MSMRSATSFSPALATLLGLVAATLFVSSSVFAQVDGPSQENIDAALQDLSALYGSPILRIDQAKAICDEEQYMVECAEIGKRHGLFGEEREREVDTLLSQLKGRVVDELKECGSTECLIVVATKIATDLSRSNPTLARTVNLTPQEVEEKRSIIEVSKSIGVDFDECRTMDPDTASVELLRACAKLAKHEQIQRHIPEESRENANKTEETAELKEALESGKIACGDGTIEGCGTFCLNPTESQREEGLSAIPPICRQIAERFFGPEGVAELERTYGAVRRTYEEVRDIYREGRNGFTEVSDENFDESDIPPYMRARPLPGVICPVVENTPCPPGHYRQGSVNELGCYVRSACIPFNTETQPEKRERDKNVICPAMPTVESCGPGEDKVISYSSPGCGTYYACRPKPRGDEEKKFPYKFESGRAVLSFDEARIYCYESGSKGATARGDKDECLRAFGITVPDIPKEKQCAEYGSGWHTMDGSGNCFNEQMTEYRAGNGALRQCAESPVYGCTTMHDKPPSEQREQVWNELGLRSWVRVDASEPRIADLKAACKSVSSGSNVWVPEAGTYSSADFGMPDPEKCKKAAACAASQYFNGSECVKSEWQQCGPNYFWNGRQCEPTNMSTSTRGGDSAMQRCFYPNASKNGTNPGYTIWCEADYYNCHEGSPSGASVDLAGVSLGAPSSCESGYPEIKPQETPTCPRGQYWNGTSCKEKEATVSGSCSGDIKSQLGTGCHSMGNAWFNGVMTMYILPGSTILKSCAAEKISGCSGTHSDVACPAGQFWSGSSCVSSEGTICGQGEYWDSGKGACMSAPLACASAGGTWDSTQSRCVMPAPTPAPTPTTGPTPTPISSTPPSGQKSQVWNSYGLQSWIRDDASASRITSLKEACANVKSSSANIWMPGAGTYSSQDFGMPDPAKCARAAECTSSQYFDGANCVSGSTSGSGGGGSGSSMSRCFYPNASKNGTNPGYTIWCEADYYNCHEGSPSGASVDLAGVSLGAPSSCESGWSGGSSGTSGGSGGCGTYTSYSSCTSSVGCLWGGGTASGYCYNSSSGSGSGGSWSSCPSNQYWDTRTNSCQSMEAACAEAGGSWSSSSNYCVMPGTSSGSSGGSSSCPSGQYWDSSTNSCKSATSNESACTEAGGTWDTAGSYCRMSSASLSTKSLAYLCPSGHDWNGGFCTLPRGGAAQGFVASVISAFLSLFRP